MDALIEGLQTFLEAYMPCFRAFAGSLRKKQAESVYDF